MVAVHPRWVGPARALAGVAGNRARVLVLGLDALGDTCWSVLAAAGVGQERRGSVAAAVAALGDPAEQGVIASAELGGALIAEVRARPDLPAAHVVVCAALD